VSPALERTFSSLRVPNYRRYFGGQVVSISGNWMQIVAEMWLIVQLTGSGAAVGITAGLQFLPVLLFGAWGGVLADRFDKRALLTITQLCMAIPALALWGLTAGGAIEAWMVYALVLLRGSVTAIDNPARQAFVMEMVGPDRVVNAVALNSVIVHSARIAGPAAAGGLIALLGVAACFAVNASTFLVMIAALRLMDPALLQRGERAPRSPGQLRAALAYVRATPALRIPLAMMVVAGTVTFNFQVLLPLLAADTWHGTAATYATLTAAMGVGSVLGALAAGARGRVTPELLVGAAALFGAAELLVALAPSLELQAIALVPMGAASVTFAAGVNSSLQLAAAPGMRGRVLALYSIVFLGSTPIGAPLVGWLAEVAGPRSGLFAGAAAAFVAAAYARWAYAKHAGARPAELGGRGARRGDREAKHGDQAGDSTGVAARLGDHRVDQHHEQRAGGEPIERRARLARDRIGDRVVGDGGDHADERDGDPEAHDRRSPHPRRIHRAR
jgi:MFS family permease